MKFTINENTWRCGGNGDEYDDSNKLGKGPTRLLNGDGYMCCLGQISCQLGYSKSSLMDIGSPVRLAPNKEDKILRGWDGCSASKLAQEAMRINDDHNISLEKRKQDLINLFKEYNHEVEFIKE